MARLVCTFLCVAALLTAAFGSRNLAADSPAAASAAASPVSPEDTALPLFTWHSHHVVDKRWLFIPIDTPSNYSSVPQDEPPKTYLRPSAWIGIQGYGGLFGGGSGSGPENIEVVDLQSGQRRRVFDRPAAIISWRSTLRRIKRGDEEESQYFQSEERFRWSIDKTLVILARPKDSNHDGFVSERDQLGLFVYDVASGHLKAVDLGSYDILRIDQIARDDFIGGNGALLILLGKDVDGACGRPRTTVYLYDIAKYEGRFLLKDATP